MIALFTCYLAVENFYRAHEGENLRSSDVLAALAARFHVFGFDGLTIIETRGYWQGSSERGFKVETIAHEGYQHRFVAACARVARDFGEDCTLYSVSLLEEARTVKPILGKGAHGVPTIMDVETNALDAPGDIQPQVYMKQGTDVAWIENPRMEEIFQEQFGNSGVTAACVPNKGGSK